MGFPPIGIMSLSAVLKEAGHECVMFDQANPETPNDVIIEADQKKRPVLMGLSFPEHHELSHAKILARQIRAADTKVSWHSEACSRVSMLRSSRSSVPRSISSAGGMANNSFLDFLGICMIRPRSRRSKLDQGRQSAENPNRKVERHLDQWPFPDRESLPLDFVESMPLDVPAVLSMERFTTMQTSRGCPWSCCSATFRYSTKGNGAPGAPNTSSMSSTPPEARLRVGLFRG